MRSSILFIAACLLVAPVAADPVVVPLLPPVDESSPDEGGINQTCDPVGLVCVGPYGQGLPVWISITSGGANATLDDEATFGPIYNNDTIPVVVCPNTCPLPAAGAEFDVHVCGTVENTTQCVLLTDEPVPPCSEAEGEVFVCMGTNHGEPTLLQVLGVPGWPGLQIHGPVFNNIYL